MTRAEFLGALRQGLGGLPPAQIDELVADYDVHFADGLAAGRSEEEIAAALGEPVRLARELKAEAGFRRWESERSPGSLAGVVLALLGLATVDVVFLLPLLCTLAGIFLGFGAAALALFLAGIVVALASFLPGLAWFDLGGGLGGVLALGLAGVGLIAGGVGLAALLWLALDLMARLLVRYARLHFQLIDAVST